MFTPDAPSFQTLRRVPLATIDAIVSARLGVKGNTQPAVFNRQIAMYLARHVGGWSTTAIGKFYSGSHHTTVLYMREVTGVNDAGRELLAAMQRAGACFTAEGVAMTAVIEEITGKQPLNAAQRQRRKKNLPRNKIPGRGDTRNETEFRSEIETRGMGISRCAGGRTDTVVDQRVAQMRCNSVTSSVFMASAAISNDRIRSR